MQGLGERLVIRQDVELPAVKHVPEMPEAEIGGEQLAIEGSRIEVFQLRGIQLLAEEGEGPPAAAAAAAAGLPLL